MKKIRLRNALILAAVLRAGKFLLRTHLLTIWVGLGALGFWVGTQARPESGEVPFEELFENLRVLSYREAPSDSTARFVVELAARGRPFRQYDVDARVFVAPPRSHDYWRSISGTRYPPLKVRGHVSRGFWLELPASSANALRPEQFDELYSTTLDFVKPLSIASAVFGLLSGYSVGYRLATWSSSLSNPAVQERVLAVPGIGRMISREAWRRVALEPVVVFAENDVARFASINGRQRLYTNFFRLAVNDSNGFIPYEVARLESAGRIRESRAMHAFARAVRVAAQDTSDLSSADFSAIEEWASLLDRRGHWASAATPPPGEDRLRYFGTLAWYGLAPEGLDQRRIWVGPRVLVRNGDAEGFVADEIPSIRVACPVSWREWLGANDTGLSASAWTARWMVDARRFAPVVNLCMGIARAVREKQNVTPLAPGGAPVLAAVPIAPERRSNDSLSLDLRRVVRTDSQLVDTIHVDSPLSRLSDSVPAPKPQGSDSLRRWQGPPAPVPDVSPTDVSGLDE